MFSLIVLVGWYCFHSIVNIVLAYCLLKISGPRIVTVIMMFALNVVSVLISSRQIAYLLSCPHPHAFPERQKVESVVNV